MTPDSLFINEILCRRADEVCVYGDRGQWLATIFFDNDYGNISVHSEYGNYAHTWSKSGRGTALLTGFLIHAGPSYIMDKFSYGTETYFDSEATLKQIRSDILEKRRGREITKEQAQICWREVEELEDADHIKDFQYYFNEYCLDTFDLIYRDDYSAIPCVTDYHPRLRKFMEVVWPIFIDGLKQDDKFNCDWPRYSQEPRKETT